MDLRQVILICASVYALLQFGLLPKLKNLWPGLSQERKFKRATTIAILEKLRTYALIGALAYLGALVVRGHCGSGFDKLSAGHCGSR